MVCFNRFYLNIHILISITILFTYYLVTYRKYIRQLVMNK